MKFPAKSQRRKGKPRTESEFNSPLAPSFCVFAPFAGNCLHTSPAPKE
jgi:hypothetical protein